MTRNLFDQYRFSENRLTHALLSTLTYDRRLLSNFLKRYAKGARFKQRTLEVAEQTMPGDPEPTTPDDFDKSLPDGVIFENTDKDTKDDKKQDRNKALIIESKITSRLTNYQLERHTRGVQARGFVVSGLAITLTKSKHDCQMDGLTNPGQTFTTGLSVSQINRFGRAS